jgi:aminopeptidase N
MLRWTLGDSIFFKGINQYLTDPKLAYGFARTADLQRNLEDVSGKDLDYFFNQWFYGEGYPSFTVQWYQDSLNRKMHFFVSETTSVPSSVDFFRVSLPIELVNGGNKKTIVVQCKYNNQEFQAPDPGFIVNRIIIDSNKYLISKNNKAVKTSSPQNTNENISAEAQSLAIAEISVSPNPVTNIAVATLKNIKGKAELQLFSSSGSRVWNKIVDTHEQQLQVQIPFSSYPNGIYKLVLNGMNGEYYSVTISK